MSERMANSSATGKVSGHKSAFSQTCNLLSQYMKEKKAIGDLSLGMFGNSEERDLLFCFAGPNDVFRPTTMNLFPVNNKPEEKPLLSAKPIGLFPQQQAGLAAPSSGPKSSQMTIFYGGQVIVFNDFPAHKAKEIMELASLGVSQKSNTNTIPVGAHATTKNTNTNNTSPAMNNTVDMTSLAPPSLNTFANSTNNSHQIQEGAQQPTTPVIADLPIARKASLHRFLEKRKDRIKAKAPYAPSKADDMPSKPKESNSWLGLAAAQPSSLQSED